MKSPNKNSILVIFFYEDGTKEEKWITRKEMLKLQKQMESKVIILKDEVEQIYKDKKDGS
jgi:hypothetical protein